jgi:basic amino acid/polyamine antiporter, APA family
MSFASQLFATTNVDKLRALAQQKILKRALTAKDLIAIGLGTMIGGGIFTSIGTGVAGAGPSVIVSYLLAGITSFFAALCYAELGAMVPVAGSAYTYAYATLGKLFAWIIGFALIFEYGISAAPVASQFSSALLDVLHSAGLTLPEWAQVASDGTKLHLTGAWWLPSSWDLLHSHYDVLGALFVIVLSILLSIGIRESATTNNIFVVLKIGALLVFIVAGIPLFHPEHFANFAPFGWGALQPFGGMADYSSSAQPYGIVAVSAFVFFSYIGFDTATTTAEECKNPQSDVPIGVMGALGIGTLIYCATAVVLIGAVPWNKVPQADPLVYALAPLHMPWVSAIITIGVLAGTTSVALSSLLGQARIFYVMARDKMLPPWVAKINPRFKTPLRTTMITGFAVAFLTLIVPLNDLLNLVNIGTLSAFTVVCGGVIYLRKRRPDLPRTFRVPFVPLFPVLGIVLSLFLAVFGLSSKTWTWFVIALIAGLLVFFSYGFRKSKPDEIEPVLEPEALEP